MRAMRGGPVMHGPSLAGLATPELRRQRVRTGIVELPPDRRGAQNLTAASGRCVSADDLDTNNSVESTGVVGLDHPRISGFLRDEHR